MRGVALRWLAASVAFGSFLGLALQAAAAEPPAMVTVSGVVLGPGDSPVADAQVYAVYTTVSIADYATHTDTARTDTEGRFSITLATEHLIRPPQAYFWVSADGFAVEWITCKLDGDQELTFRLSEGARLAGRVVDQTGAGVAEAEVQAFLTVQRRNASGSKEVVVTGPPFGGLTTRTDDTGHFVLSTVPKEAKAEFLVAAPGKAVVQTARLHVRPAKFRYNAGDEDILIVLPPQAVVRGVLVHARTGAPIAGQRLETLSNVDHPSACVSKDDGTFELTGLGAGGHSIKLVPPEDGQPGWVAGEIGVTTEIGSTIDNLKIECYPAGILDVRILDAVSGAPVETALVVGHTDAPQLCFAGRMYLNGERRFRVAPNTYGLHVTEPDYVRAAKQVVRIDAGVTTRVTLTIQPAPRVTGIVLDPAGKPVSGATVQVDGTGPKTRTDEEGRFELKAQDRTRNAWQPGHTFSLWVSAAQKGLAIVRNLDYGGQTMRVTLRPYRTLTGRVIDRDGKPVPQAEVTADWKGKPYTARTNADGRYEFTRMPMLSPDQSFRLEARAADYAPGLMQFLLRQDQGELVAVRDLLLEPAPLSVSGVVVDTEGRPVPHVLVEAYRKGHPGIQARTDQRGRFTIEGLAEGKVWLYMPESPAPNETEVDAGAKDVRLVHWIELRVSRPAPDPHLP